MMSKTLMSVLAAAYLIDTSVATFETLLPGCGSTCTTSAECPPFGDCMQCIEGTCQHRCANGDCGAPQLPVCGSACTAPIECSAAGDCTLCLSGTCQHRCTDKFLCDVPSSEVCVPTPCTSSTECTSGDCNLCLSGTCQHRCANGDCDQENAITCGSTCTSDD